jgi:hypothetical protein
MRGAQPLGNRRSAGGHPAEGKPLSKFLDVDLRPHRTACPQESYSSPHPDGDLSPKYSFPPGKTDATPGF